MTTKVIVDKSFIPLFFFVVIVSAVQEGKIGRLHGDTTIQIQIGHVSVLGNTLLIK